jgi:hypothetical protein
VDTTVCKVYHRPLGSFVFVLCSACYLCNSFDDWSCRCPTGTFSNTTANIQLSDCVSCTPGDYCDVPGLVQPAGLCQKGFYCLGGASAAVQDTTTSTGGPCTTGHYCGTGSSYPVPCPGGTYMATTHATGNTTVDSILFICTPCTGGKACTATGLSSPDAVCGIGHWCQMGAPSIYPICSSSSCADLYGICPVGSYCPYASVIPAPCAAGTFMNHTGAESCDQCPPGRYCNPSVSTSATLECPQGYYCPAGTGLDWQPCPIGKYGASAGLQSENECTMCTAGMYCSSEALKAPNGLCTKGFYCPLGSRSGVGLTAYAPNHTCPFGSYCPKQSIVPNACPPGTYNPSRQQYNLSQCLDCTPGSFCASFNMSSPTAKCDPGFYCTIGSNVSNPTSMFVNDLTGQKEPRGHMFGSVVFCKQK